MDMTPVLPALSPSRLASTLSDVVERKKGVKRSGENFFLERIRAVTAACSRRRAGTLAEQTRSMGIRRCYGNRKARIMPQSSSNDLSDLFEDTLKDIYFAEKQILRALPKMAKAASSPQLREAFEAHRQETEGHVERLEQIFEKLGKAARGKTCDAILGIIDESKEIMEKYQGKSALDAGLAASGQAVEHYEMARYGTLKTWATQLGMADAAKLLDQTLQEEKAADELLTRLATADVNKKAA
jgi:ferritin-like metal-binding protein YciE